MCLAFPLLAHGQEASFSVTLEDLVPGVPRTETGSVQLDRDAMLTNFTWLQLTGILEDATIEVEVCVPGDWCVDANDPDDSIFPAGTLQVVITATLPDDAPAGGSGSATGRFVFFADSDGEDGDPDLPLTGLELMGMTAWAVAFVSVGALIVVISRRRNGEESP